MALIVRRWRQLLRGESCIESCKESCSESCSPVMRQLHDLLRCLAIMQIQRGLSKRPGRPRNRRNSAKCQLPGGGVDGAPPAPLLSLLLRTRIKAPSTACWQIQEATGCAWSPHKICFPGARCRLLAAPPSPSYLTPALLIPAERRLLPADHLPCLLCTAGSRG